MTSMHRWVCALVAALLLPRPILGQEYRGRVQGSLTDETQLAVPGAQVTLRNDATGVSVTRVTGPEGRYLFDYVDPGTYTLTAELSGFATVVQRNVLVQARGDVTADVTMKVAALSETVTVETQPVAIQFNTSSKDLTLDQSFLESIPNITRNPTQLAYLSPVVRNAGNKNETSPYHHWAGNDMDIGGGTRRRNDVLLDGTPLEAGPKVAYTPPMDAIAEFNVSTNAVDAEFGHSAGGIISMSLKSGTNAYHGTGYYVGRNADWNAVTNRVTRQHSDNTYSQTGGTLGMPLRRNKIFLFTSIESSRVTEVLPRSLTMPTALERQGDFSQSFNRDGTLRVIYDPWTSRFGPNGQIIRDPFPGNKIPANRFDPLGAKLMSSLWAPNGPGDDRTGLNNFKYNQEFDFEYLNFSTRLDWNLNDKWKTFARVSRFQTDQVQPDFTGGVDHVQDAARAGQQAQRLEHRRRHGLHDELDDRAQRARRVLSGRGQARLSRDGAPGQRPVQPVVELVVPALHGGPSDSVFPRNQHGQLRHLRRGQRVVADSRGLQPARPVQQVPPEALDQVRHRSAHQARRSRTLPLLQLRDQRERDGEHHGESESEPGRPSVGQLHAGRAREHFERRVRSDADVRHGDVRAVRAGRLPHSREADAEPRPSMGVRGRSLRSGVSASARSRSDSAGSWPAGGHRSAHSRQHQGDDGGIGRAEQLSLQRRVLLHRRREPAERQRVGPAADAASRPRVERQPQDGRARRLRPLLHAADARQRERHDGPAQPRRVQPVDARSSPPRRVCRR